MNGNEVVAERINEILQEYDYEPMDMLVGHVSNLCNVSVDDLMSSRDRTYIAQARWLLWYSYRYMTHESYTMIAKRFHGVFHQRTVAFGIVKMSRLIEADETWRKRWKVIRHIIRTSCPQEEDENVTIVVQVPKGMSGEVKLEVKEV